MSLRMEPTEQAYQDARAAGHIMPLNEEAQLQNLPQWHYWKIIANRFPHDRHHTMHLLAVLRRDCPVTGISVEELEELWFGIIPWADAHFDYVKFNLSSMRTVKNTPHLHLLVLKPEYK